MCNELTSQIFKLLLNVAVSASIAVSTLADDLVPPSHNPSEHRLKKVPQEGRSEPKYVGLKGFIAPDRYSSTSDFGNSLPGPWRIFLLKQSGPKLWESSDEAIPAQTPVTVIEQHLEHKGYKRYEGRLVVERQDTKEIVNIDPDNFVLVDYWNCPPEHAIEQTIFIADIKDPTVKLVKAYDGRWLDLPHSNRVLVMERDSFNDAPNMLSCLVYTNKGQTYACSISASNLTIVR